MTATLAGYAGLAFATGQYLRPHYEAPLITSDPNVGTPALLISQWWTRGDTPVSMSALNQALQRDGAQEISPGRFQTNGLTQNSVDPVQYLTQHGFTQWTSYQPASRFWPFQWIEGGWLLALSVLLIAATIWLVRRRAT